MREKRMSWGEREERKSWERNPSSSSPFKIDGKVLELVLETRKFYFFFFLPFSCLSCYFYFFLFPLSLSFSLLLSPYRVWKILKTCTHSMTDHEEKRRKRRKMLSLLPIFDFGKKDSRLNPTEDSWIEPILHYLSFCPSFFLFPLFLSSLSFYPSSL